MDLQANPTMQLNAEAIFDCYFSQSHVCDFPFLLVLLYFSFLLSCFFGRKKKHALLTLLVVNDLLIL